MAVAVAIGGCMSDGDEPANESETSSDISMAGGATWNGQSNIVLGSIDQQTCFLDGISGSFNGIPGTYNEDANGALTGERLAEVRVFPNFTTRKWEMGTTWGTGTGVQAGVVCINVPYTGSSVHEFPWSDNITSGGYTGTANTHCFLRDLWASTGLDGTSFEGEQTNIQISSRAVGGGQIEFDMNSSYVHNIDGDGDYGGAIAVCVDYAASNGWGYSLGGGFNDFLRNSYPSGAPVATANTLCSITGVIGNLTGQGFTNGVILDNSGADWKATATNGRTATVACVR